MAESEEDKTVRNVFISYGRETDVTSFVKQLKKDLEANGYTVWLDLESIPSGSDWHGAIGTGLHDCASIIPIVTQKYIGSRYCMNELYSADGDKKWIFPIMYQDVDLTNSEEGRALKFIVSGINWSMFRPGQDDYSKSLQRLVEGMRLKAKEEAKKAEIKAEEEKAFVITVGPTSSEPLNVISGIESPSQIATGCNGEIVVASYKDHKILVYDQDCKLLHTFGSSGFLDGQFMHPSGVAVDSHNRVFVSSLNKVDVFTMDGQFVTAAGSQGNGPLQFTNATGIAVGKNGKVYIADAQNNRIQVLNSDLSFYMLFSEACKTVGPGRLNQPQAVAINSEGNLFVADMMNHTVQVFSPDDGKFLYRFGKYGTTTTPGALSTPMAIAIDAEDNVYVSSSTGSIAIFSKDGEFKRQFGSYGSEQGQFSMIKGLHIDSKGCLYTSEWIANRVQIFPTSLSVTQPKVDVEESNDSVIVAHEEKESPVDPVREIGPTSSVPIRVIPDINGASGVTEGKNGEVIVIGKRDHKGRVMVYSPVNDYQLLREFGDQGPGDDQSYFPAGVSSTPEGVILVSSSNKLQWFTMEGNIVHVVGSRRYFENKSDFDTPTDIAIGRNGLIYVLDTGKKCVKVLRSNGIFHSSFTFPYLDTDDKKAPTAMAINSEEKLFFTDFEGKCVRVFSTCGEALFEFGKYGHWTERGALMAPCTIAIDHNDNIFVGNVIMLSIFDKSGAFLLSFGGPDQFSFIDHIHIGRSGHIYISDSSMNNVKIFEGPKPSDSDKPPDDQKVKKELSFPRPLYTVGPSSKQPVKVIPAVMDPHGAATTANGCLFVVAKKSIQFFSSDTFERVWEIDRLCSDKARYNEMTDLKDIALFNENGSFLITMNHQVLKVTPNGDVIASFGTPGRYGNTETQLNSPSGIAVGREGQVYVVEWGDKCIKILNADLSYKASATFPATAVEAYPPSLRKIALNSKGSIYVTDTSNELIHVFDQEGKFLFSFATMFSPSAIAVDHEDFIYFADSNRIWIIDTEGHFMGSLGGRGDKPGEFRDIKALHVSDAGNLFVCESKNNCIQVFTGLKTKVLAKRDRACKKDAVLDTIVPDVCLRDVHDPFGIAAGKNGEIVVANTSEHKVSVYNNQQQLVVQFGVRGTLDGQMVTPTGVTITADNYILVSCCNKLQWFTMKGELVYAVGSKGKEVLEFNYPLSIALGSDDKIYVLEKCNKRVQILKGDASFHSSFNFDKKHTPEAIAIDSQGRIFLANTIKSCVQIYSQEGTHISMFNMTGSCAPTFPTAIAIDHKDNVYIGTANGEVFVFDNCGCFLQGFRASGSPGCYSVIRGLHVSQSGHVYISDFSTNEVRAFKQLNILSSAEGMSASTPSLPVLPYSPIYKVGPKSAQPVRVLSGVRDPNGVVTDNRGNVIVTSKQEKKILIYSLGDGDKPSRTISELKNPKESCDGSIINPAGLAYTHDGYLLVCFGDQMVKMDYNGTAVAFLGNPRNHSGTKNDELRNPGGLALDSNGDIYLVDCGNHRIQIFDSNFSFVKSLFNLDSREQDVFERVAVNSTGDLYVTDRCNHNVHVFNKVGRFMFKFGRKVDKWSCERGRLYFPHAIAIDKDDFVYVGDEIGVVSIFDKDGSFIRSFGGCDEDECGDIRAMHFDAEGQLYVCEWKTDRVQVFK